MTRRERIARLVAIEAELREMGEAVCAYHVRRSRVLEQLRATRAAVRRAGGRPSPRRRRKARWRCEMDIGLRQAKAAEAWEE